MNNTNTAFGRLFWFAIGAAAGAAALHLAQSGKAKKAAVAVAAKGLELKDRISASLERGKESLQDALAEARYVADQKKD